jgi:hypothetical protein
MDSGFRQNDDVYGRTTAWPSTIRSATVSCITLNNPAKANIRDKKTVTVRCLGG